jgi:DNA damage-binding protein 1
MFWRGLLGEHKGYWSRSQPEGNNVCAYHRHDLGFPTSSNLPREVGPLLNAFPSRLLKELCRSDTHIVVSTSQETHLFRVDEDEERLWYMDPITVGGLVTSKPTLALANVMGRVPGMSGASAYGDSSFVIQVTPIGVCVLEMDRELGTTTSIGSLVLGEITAWKEKRVVATSINSSQVIIALDGGVIASFALNEHGHLQIRQ